VRERDIERYLVERVVAMGGEVRKLRWLGRNGAPDRLVLLPGGRLIFIEVKAPEAGARPGQQREHCRLRAMGQRVEIVASFDDVDDVLQHGGR